MIRRRDNIWVEIHDINIDLPNRRNLEFVDPGHGVPVTYTSLDHHQIALGTVRELVPYAGYVDATGKLLPAHSGPDSIGEKIRRAPHHHQVRPVWRIDFDGRGEPIIVIREIAITRVPHRIKHAEVKVTRAGGERPSPYTKSATDTSHAATGHARVNYAS